MKSMTECQIFFTVIACQPRKNIGLASDDWAYEIKLYACSYFLLIER